jgi:nucleoside-diphosphate-sugar epimerase
LRYSARVKLLVLGGSGFVGPAVVEDALRRGWEVATFNRGHGEPPHPDVERLVGDRLAPRDLDQLGSRSWDVVVDTWAGAPRAARDSATVLAGCAERYVYVSSESVYAHPPPLGADESAETVAASPDGEDDGDYASLKRGAELAIEAAFGDCALLARPGAILGPREDVGRLPWWLLRMERGGEVLAPGPRERPLQYVDARDLARWLLDAAEAEASGPFNVVCRKGHATMGTLLDACREATGGAAEVVWVSPAHVESAGIEPWTELPLWIPPDHEYAWLHDMNVDRAHAGGLRCRPVEETVRDTWEWLVSIGRRPPLKEYAASGVDEASERAVLAAWRSAGEGVPGGR